MLFIRSQKGFSLIEAVVGMVLLAILVGAVLSVTLGDKTSARKNLTFNASCKAEAQRIMSVFKGKGLVRDHYSFPSRTAVPTAGPGGSLPLNTTVSVPNEPSAIEVGVNDGGNFVDRWLNTGAPDRFNTPFTTGNPTAGVLTLLRPYTLIMGTISTLEAIHNNFSAVCTAPPSAIPGMQASSAPAPLSTIFVNPVGVEDSTTSNTGLFDPDAYLYIRMFDTATGAPFPVNPCGGAHDHVAMPSSSPTGMLNMFPPGLTPNVNFPPADPPAAAMQIGQIPPSVRLNAGYEVTITVDYDVRDGTRQFCSVTEKFQYPLNMADPARPLRLDDVDAAESPIDDSDAPEEINTFVRSNTLNDYSAGNLPPRNCNAAPSALNFRVANVRPGSVFMCRNLTQLRPITGPGFDIPTAGLRRLDVSVVNGLRQTFYSSELTEQATSNDNGPSANAAQNAQGFFQYNSLYYPFGTYYCNATEGCDNLPRFPTTATTTFNNYDVRTPSTHLSNTATGWNNTFKTGRWVPCEYAQISCATNAYSASGVGNETLYNPTTQYVKGSGTVADGYHIQYGLPPDVLPPGCEVHMQVAEVDSTYNVRTIEFYEYTHEVIPGDRLVHIAGQPISQWHFVCSTASPAPTGPASGVALQCPTIGVGRGPTTAQTFNLAASCYINFPGSPSVTGDYRDGVWRSDPSNSEAGP